MREGERERRSLEEEDKGRQRRRRRRKKRTALMLASSLAGADEAGFLRRTRVSQSCPSIVAAGVWEREGGGRRGEVAVATRGSLLLLVPTSVRAWFSVLGRGGERL